MTISIYTAAEKPQLVEQTYELNAENWPVFLQNSPVSVQFWPMLFEAPFSQYQLIATQLDEQGVEQVIGTLNALPVNWNGDDFNELPANGWDTMFMKGIRDNLVNCNLVSLLAVTVAPSARGQHLPERLINHLKERLAKTEITHLIAAVRPSLKARYPLQSMQEYLQWKNDKNESFDPWVRMHERLGAKAYNIAPSSMNIYATLDEWTHWTGLKFPVSGHYVIDGGLVVLDVDKFTNMGIYREPNLWMVHTLSPKK